MKGIYSFYEDCYYGSLEGVFVADSKDVVELIGKEVYFGEVLGKHSEVVCEITSENFTLKSIDPEHIATFINLGLASGYNPFDFDVCGED